MVVSEVFRGQGRGGSGRFMSNRGYRGGFRGGFRGGNRGRAGSNANNPIKCYKCGFLNHRAQDCTSGN